MIKKDVNSNGQVNRIEHNRLGTGCVEPQKCHHRAKYNFRQTKGVDKSLLTCEKLIPELVRKYIETLEDGGLGEPCRGLFGVLYHIEPAKMICLCECGKEMLRAQVRERLAQMR